MTELGGLRVAVAGLGPMGRGIARVFDRAGAQVTVFDVSEEATRTGLDRIRREAADDDEPVRSVADRLAFCMANEAMAVAEEGTATAEDDGVALRLAMNLPLGPFEHVERIGAGIVHEGLRSLAEVTGDPRYGSAQLLRRRAARVA